MLKHKPLDQFEKAVLAISTYDKKNNVSYGVDQLRDKQIETLTERKNTQS